MVDPEIYMPIAFGILILLLLIMVAIGIPRGKRMQQTNEQIEANQRKMMALSERQAVALERIAEALERRG